MARHNQTAKNKRYKPLPPKKKPQKNHFEILESHLPGFCTWVLEGLGEEKELGEAGPIDDILLMVSDRLCVKENLVCRDKPNPPLYFFTLCALLLTEHFASDTSSHQMCGAFTPQPQGSNTNWVSYSRTPF